LNLRLYETTIITDSQLEEADTEKEIKQIQELISQQGGEILETQRWGTRRFAYEIKGRKQGCYTHFLYLGESRTPAALQEAFKVNERIMRFLTVLSELDPEAKQAELAAKRQQEAAREAPTEPPAKPESKVASEYEDEEIN
jgi:small subunit ribosomal protein S6